MRGVKMKISIRQRKVEYLLNLVYQGFVISSARVWWNR